MNHKKILDEILKEAYQTTNMGNSLEDQAYVMACLCLGVLKRSCIEFNRISDFPDELQDKVIKVGVKLLNGEIKPDKYTTDFLALAKKILPKDAEPVYDQFVKDHIISRVSMSYGTGKKEDRKQSPNFDKGKVTESKKNFKEEGRCGGSMKKEDIQERADAINAFGKLVQSKEFDMIAHQVELIRDFPNHSDITSDEAKKVMDKYLSPEEKSKIEAIIASSDNDLDPSGGRGLHSHLEENDFGTPISYKDLEKGKTYTWTGGAEMLDIKYLGIKRDNQELPIGSSVGKGFVFQWVESGKYLELGPQTIAKDVIEKENETPDVSPAGERMEELQATSDNFTPKTKMLAPFEEESEEKLNPIAQWVLDHEKEISDETFYNDPKVVERIAKLKTADEVEDYYVNERDFEDTDYLRKDLRTIMRNVDRIEASMGKQSETDELDELESTTDTFGTNSRLMEDDVEKIKVGDTFGSHSFPYSLIITSIEKDQAKLSKLVFYRATGESVIGEFQYSLPISEIERLLSSKDWKKVKVTLAKSEKKESENYNQSKYGMGNTCIPPMKESTKVNDINVWKQQLRENHGLVVYNESADGKIAISQDRKQIGDWNETLCEGRIFKESVAISINEDPEEESFDETAEQMFENMLAEDGDLGEGDDVYYTAEGSDSKIAARILAFVREGIEIELLRNTLGYQVGDTIIVSKSELEKR